jgi:hypothetical protein
MTPALGLTVYHLDKANHGYTLFTPMTGTSAYLIDMQGCVVHHWALPYRPGAYGYLLDTGHLLVAGRTDKSPVPFGGAGGTLMELAWDVKVLWEHVEDTMHHDFCRLPNGNTMVLGWEPVPADMRDFAACAPDLPPFPDDFDEMCRLVEAVAGVRFQELFERLPRRAATGDAALAAVFQSAQEIAQSMVQQNRTSARDTQRKPGKQGTRRRKLGKKRASDD